ncbi:MAG: hypothetical protein QOH72_2981 [Solirubrobacteraceae bacterium]|nr:hypothetical protein [Solirubrobacteraceae bacterium]
MSHPAGVSQPAIRAGRAEPLLRSAIFSAPGAAGISSIAMLVLTDAFDAPQSGADRDRRDRGP